MPEEKLKAASELLITTREPQYAQAIEKLLPELQAHFSRHASWLVRVMPFMSEDFNKQLDKNRYITKDNWINSKVWWKEKEDKLITEISDEGIELTYTGYFNNFFKPFDEQSYINQGLIRVKI